MVGSVDGNLRSFRFTRNNGFNDFFYGPNQSGAWVFSHRWSSEVLSLSAIRCFDFFLPDTSSLPACFVADRACCCSCARGSDAATRSVPLVQFCAIECFRERRN